MLRSFEQKRRNRPIIITDVAISKVPMIPLQGFSEEENIFIQQQHMRLLRKAMITQGRNTMMFMHNHPSTGTFSGTDFKTFCNNESLYIMTVVGNDGSVKVLIKQNEFNSSDALLYYYDLVKKYNKYENNGARAMKELLKNCDEIGLVYVR